MGLPAINCNPASITSGSVESSMMGRVWPGVANRLAITSCMFGHAVLAGVVDAQVEET